MRLNLYWRGRDVIDLELHAWRKRDTEPDEGPTLQASGHLQDSSRAEPIEPDTAVFGFTSTQWRAPHEGGYRPKRSKPEPTSPPRGSAGTSPRARQ